MSFLQRLLFPPKCAGCAGLIPINGIREESLPLCKPCQAKWQEELLQECEFCRQKVSECTCMTEAQRKTGCQNFRKLVFYRHASEKSVQNHIIYQLKNAPNAKLTEFLISYFLPAFSKQCGELGMGIEQLLITYVPRSPRAILDSGNDQAKEIAMALSKQTGIPLVKALSRRHFQSKEQKHLSPLERRKNAKKSFSFSENADVNDKTVFLVDDIVTTGESMAACANLLKQAGATAVYCFSIASDDMNQHPTLRQPQLLNT